MVFTRDKEIGRGTYGIVHSGDIEYTNGKKQRGACKQTFHKVSISGLSILREIQMLQTCSNKCIHMPKLLGVFFEDYSRKRIDDTIIKRENVTFVTELLDFNGSQIFGKRDYDMGTMIDMAAQIFTGVAFMHGEVITHRDIKPSNLLFKFDPSTGKPTVKICDFGLAQYLTISAASTPETNTAFYRPPEVCWSINKYGDTSDVWAVAATIFEMLTGESFIYSDSSSSDQIFYEILKNNPNSWSEILHRKYISNTNVPIKIAGTLDPQTLPPGENLLDRLTRSRYYKQSDHSNWVKFESILKKCFTYDYSNRISCWTILNDSLFDPLREQISSVTQRMLKPKVNEIININIEESINLRKETFFKRFTTNSPRFKLRPIFHAVDLTNRILTNPEFLEESQHVERVAAASIYFFHKFFNALSIPEKMQDFFTGVPKISDQSEVYLNNVWDEEEYYKMDEWIYTLDLKILKILFPSFKIYRAGLFEIPDEYEQTLSKQTLKILLMEFIKISTWSNASYRGMYRHLYRTHIDPNYVFKLKS